jgi:hypothetical protein
MPKLGVRKKSVSNRVAGRNIFKPKIPEWANFVGTSNQRCWYILWLFGQFSFHLEYFMAIWHIFTRFGTFYPFWYVVPRKIWHPWFQRGSKRSCKIFKEIFLTTKRQRRQKNECGHHLKTIPSIPKLLRMMKWPDAIKETFQVKNLTFFPL